MGMVLRRHQICSYSKVKREVNVREMLEADDADSILSYPTILPYNHEHDDCDISQQDNGANPISCRAEA